VGEKASKKKNNSDSETLAWVGRFTSPKEKEESTGGKGAQTVKAQDAGREAKQSRAHYEKKGVATQQGLRGTQSLSGSERTDGPLANFNKGQFQTTQCGKTGRNKGKIAGKGDTGRTNRGGKTAAKGWSLWPSSEV